MTQPAPLDWVVPPDHPAFAGHFPGRPILPGVLLLDAALHAAGAQAWRIASAKFLAPVAPGDALRLDWAGSSFTVWRGPVRVASGALQPAAA